MKRQQQKTAIAFESVTTQLLKDAVRVKTMREVEKRYSASLIYTTHNAIFSLSEKVETCSSCLLTRSRAIVDFVNQYDSWADEKTRQVNAQRAQEAYSPLPPAEYVQKEDSRVEAQDTESPLPPASPLEVPIEIDEAQPPAEVVQASTPAKPVKKPKQVEGLDDF